MEKEVIIRTVLVDDELRSRKSLKVLLDAYCPNVQIVGEANSAISGIKMIESTDPDLLFLDIQMPGGNGFELLKNFPNAKFGLIFSTAYDEYAMRAIKFAAIDYLQKPVDPQELISSVQKATDQKILKTNAARFNLLKENLGTERAKFKRMMLKELKGSTIVKLEDIMYFEGTNNYTYVFLSDGRKLILTKNIKRFEETLEDCNFLRVHKSYLVNIAQITGVSRENSIFLSDGKELEISRRRKDQLLAYFEY